MKTPITYYGGKQQMVKYILPLIPEHKIYVEPFFGGGAILFAKEKSEHEVINDLNSEVINFYYTLKVNTAKLFKEVSGTMAARDAFKQAKIVYDNPEMFDSVKRAWAFYTAASQAFSSNFSSYGYGLDNACIRKCANKRDAYFNAYAERLKYVEVENNDALKVIKSRDTAKSFFYCDPPYYNSNCGPYNGYSISDYTLLLKQLAVLKGKFLLSSYPSPVLDTYVAKHKWHQVSVKKKIAVSAAATHDKTEVLTANYSIEKQWTSLLQTISKSK